MKRSTCVVCGTEFEAADTLGEALIEARGATEEQRKNAREHAERFEAEHGGPRGVCSFRCLLKRLSTGTRPS
jgi:hypothetical protein